MAGQPAPAPTVAIALGSNVGDRVAHLTAAIARLAPFVTGLRISNFVETAPEDVPPQAAFLNAVLVGRTSLAPQALLKALLAIEASGGRVRPHPGAPRTIDLDLILYGGLVIDEPGLQVPHPRFRQRRFVLDPLAEVAPDLTDPLTGLTVRELANRLGTTSAGSA